MSNMGLDEDVEAIDYLGDEESDEETFDGDTESLDEEGFDDAEASAATLRRRRERRRRALAKRELDRRRRGALARARSGRPPAGRGSPATTKAAVRNTQAAVRNLDLEGKVQADAFKSALAAQAKRTSRAEIATVASAVVNQFQNTFQNRFGILQDPTAKAAISFAPLLLLSPVKQGSGAGAYARDPRVLGGAAIAAIVVTDRLTQPKAVLVTTVAITGADTIVQGPGRFPSSPTPSTTRGESSPTKRSSGYRATRRSRRWIRPAWSLPGTSAPPSSRQPWMAFPDGCW
jgi:hypothetical protein